MVQKEISFTELSLDFDEIYRTMGGAEGYTPDQQMTAVIGECMEEVKRICRPVFGYKILPVEITDKSGIGVGGVWFDTGSIITKFLRDGDRIGIFIVTAGAAFDALIHNVKAEGDIVRELILDSIGSEIAEAAARLAAAEIERTLSRGEQMSNSYSPGYCGWHVGEQQKLFSLLPPAPCGVTLSESSLMSPIKSVSGMVAIGKKVIKQPYGCAICDRRNCFKKRI